MFNVEPLVDLKVVWINLFSVRWVLSGVTDTVTVGFQKASYLGLFCAGHYLKLHNINGGYLLSLFCTSLTPPGIGTAFLVEGGEDLPAHLDSEF